MRGKYILAYGSRITESLVRSRSGGIIAALVFSTLATGVLQICLPLELRQLRTTPNEIGLTLSMFGLGMFVFEWLWGLIADRFGYGAPLVASQLLYGAFIVGLSQVRSVSLIAAGYFLASGMMVAVGPIARSYIGTALHAHLRATGLALLASQWVIAEAVGAGVGGALIDHFPIREVMLVAAVLPLVSAVLVFPVFRGFTIVDHRSRQNEVREDTAVAEPSVVRVLAITASLVLLVQVGLGGELALLPLLVTNRLQLSAAAAGSAMLAVGLIGGVLLVPGGNASDRWGRKPTMIVGGIICAAGYIGYAVAGTFAGVIAAAAIRAVGAALIWPAATAWIAESMPRRRHALYMGLFGEFENIGVTAGPIIGGVVWSVAGIQSAFFAYAAAALLAALVAAVLVQRREAPVMQPGRALAQDLDSRR